jgi:hypothetical protein
MGRRLDESRDDERRAAWSAAKLAARSYARDPSDTNADRVRTAWLRIRQAVTRTVDQRIDMELLELERRNRHH